MNESVENYGWTDAAAPQSCGYLYPAVRPIIGALASGRVVDLGAGNGALCGALATDYPGLTVVGVEYDANGVVLARTKYPHIRFFQAGVGDDPKVVLDAVGGVPFDCVVSTEVIEHLYDPRSLIRYALGLLAPEGRLVISTPYHGYIKNLAISAIGGWDRHMDPLWDGGHIKLWSRASLTKLLHEFHLEPVQFLGVGRIPFLWKSMVIVARRIRN